MPACDRWGWPLGPPAPRRVAAGGSAGRQGAAREKPPAIACPAGARWEAPQTDVPSRGGARQPPAAVAGRVVVARQAEGEAAGEATRHQRGGVVQPRPGGRRLVAVDGEGAVVAWCFGS